MNGFIQGDSMLCIGCQTCMLGCAAAHENKRISELDPAECDFHPKLSVVKTDTVTVPVQCKHCENPECMAVCKTGAIVREGDAVVIRQDKCIGCKACAEACAFGAVEIVIMANEVNHDGSQRSVANKCDLCKGIDDGPVCMKVCPTGALRCVTEDNMVDEIRRKRQQAIRVYKA